METCVQARVWVVLALLAGWSNRCVHGFTTTSLVRDLKFTQTIPSSTRNTVIRFRQRLAEGRNVGCKGGCATLAELVVVSGGDMQESHGRSLPLQVHNVDLVVVGAMKCWGRGSWSHKSSTSGQYVPLLCPC